MSELNNDNYSACITDGIVVVKFSSRRCTRCKKFVEWYNGLSYDNIKFYTADIDNVFEFDEIDTITSLPAFVKYINGKHIFTICDEQDMSIIEKNITERN